MKEIAQIRKLSLWIFFVPLIAINLCLFLSINHVLLENTIFRVDQIGRTLFTIPYIDGGVSISRVSRTFPAYLIFKPAMFITGILLIFYWSNNNKLVNNLKNTNNLNFKFKTFGILSALFLILHSIFLGIKFDFQIYKLFRRVVLLSFIIFEIIAQGILVYNFYKMKNKISNLINSKVLKIKILLVSLLAVVAILTIPILIDSGNVHFKHGLEWNYFVGVILFYLLTRLLWKKTT
jgi:hypothetical protein